MNPQSTSCINLLVSFVLLLLGLVGCDGYHQTGFQVELIQPPIDATAIVKMKKEDYKVAMQVIDNFAKNHDMKCISCEDGNLFRVYGAGYVQLESNINTENGLFSIRMVEFGPWLKTKRYATIKQDLTETLKKEFPQYSVATDQ